jgi:hypothetical protein
LAFSEAVRAAVRRNAHFACCLCHDLGVEVHHIVPQGQGGSDDESNAAPLCPTCHERYGANPDKRKFIREAREFWYELCANRYASDPDRLDEIRSILREVPTKADLESLVEHVRESSPTRASEAAPPSELPASVASQPITAVSVGKYLRLMYGTVRHCGEAECESLAADLLEVGYPDIGSLHQVMLGVPEGFADFVRDRREQGEDMDVRTDGFPVRLFLGVFDERYSRIHFPKVHNKTRTERPDYRWRRPAEPD